MRRFDSVRAAGLVLIVVCVLASTSAAAFATWPTGVAHHALPTSRVAGADRYTNSVLTARRAYPAWAGVHHVVVACGDDAYLPTALVASSLCWAYDAPMFLVGAAYMPPSVSQALSEIRSVDPSLAVTVVGNTRAVTTAVLARIKVSAGATATVEQPWPTSDPFTLSRSVAARAREVATGTARTIPSAVFIVNGTHLSRVLEGSPAAAISARTGIPIVLTSAYSPSWATRQAILESGAAERIVVGQVGGVSASAATLLDATGRWAYPTISATSVTVARRAITRGWVHPSQLVFYRALSDAISGAQLAAKSDGLSLGVASPRLEKSTADFLSGESTAATTGWLIGGTGTIPGVVLNEIRGHAAYPTLTSLHRYEGSRTIVAGRVGSNTTRVTLKVNGRTIATRSATPFASYTFGYVSVPSGRSTFAVVASNPDTLTATVSKTVERLRYPYATCIIIDKSEFRLYWVHDNSLVKTYPVAIGRPSMETPVRLWRVGAKLRCDPLGVYGPRKLALWRWTGSGWEYTNYGIHGTNEPWVIGTRASHGCIRLYNHDILEVWPQVPLYTRVITRE